VRSVGPYSVSEAVVELRRAWLEGAADLPVSLELEPWAVRPDQAVEEIGAWEWLAGSIENPAPEQVDPDAARRKNAWILQQLRSVEPPPRDRRSLETLDQAAAAGAAARLVALAAELQRTELDTVEFYRNVEDCYCWLSWSSWETRAGEVLAAVGLPLRSGAAKA
jgi:hypothetical protein